MYQRHLPRKKLKDEEGREKRTEAGEGYSCFRLSHNNFQAVERKKGVVRCETKTNIGVEGGVVTLAWWLFSSLAAREKRERRRRTRIENDRCFRAVFDDFLYARKINRIYILYIHMYIYRIVDYRNTGLNYTRNRASTRIQKHFIENGRLFSCQL